MLKKLILAVALCGISTAVHASVDPLAEIECELASQPSVTSELEELVKYSPLEDEIGDLVIQLFFPDLHFLRNAEIGEHDLYLELVEK